MTTSTPNLEFDLRIVRGAFELEAELKLEAGTRLALVGPNGSGKSSLVATLAGILEPHSGRIAFGDELWFDASGGIDRPPPQRPCALVFQNGALFPHMSAMDNVAYGLRCAGETKEQARAHAKEWLDRVALGKLADRHPHALSGGQARAVALIRALATRPSLLLLDEPFAGLDPVARERVSDLLAGASSGFDGILIWASHELRPLQAHTRVVAEIDAQRLHGPRSWESALRDPASSHFAAMVKAQST
jgi:molybdate transport system ATP-binding protein